MSQQTLRLCKSTTYELTVSIPRLASGPRRPPNRDDDSIPRLRGGPRSNGKQHRRFPRIRRVIENKRLAHVTGSDVLRDIHRRAEIGESRSLALGKYSNF